MRILSTLNEIDPPESVPPFKRIEQGHSKPEWTICKENPKYEVNSKGQWRTKDYQPEFPMAGTPWPFPKSKPVTLADFHQSQNTLLTAAMITEEAVKILGNLQPFKMGATVTIRRPSHRFLWTKEDQKELDHNEGWDGTYRHFKILRQAGKM